MTKRSLLWLVIAVAMIASAVMWWHRRTVAAPPAQQPPATAPTSSGSAATPAATPTAATAKTRKLSPEDRKQLGEKIAAAVREAREARAAQARSAGTAVADEDPVIPLESVGPELADALTAAIPILAECFQHAGITDPRTAVAQMTMTSDPDLGTVIDTADVLGPDGKKLGPTLDTCLRDSIDSLALPPLGQPGKLQIQYSFKFD
ncbi:MAG: hypothetical protein ABJE66_04090 [Deltaproteobacteria bacterium]